MPTKEEKVNLKIVFLGTPQFAVPILEKLAESDFRPQIVFAAPDRPVGRNHVVSPPPVKTAAEKLGLPVFQPETTQELLLKLQEIKPDLVLTAAYGLILSKEILAMPKFGCLNVHPSLLPKYRGAAPIHNTILNGDEKTGVTIFKMDQGIDTGPILAASERPLANRKYTTAKLAEELAKLGADLLINILPDWINGKIKPEPQDDARASYTKPIKKEDGLIDWNKPAVEIERQLRAYDKWPACYTLLDIPGQRQHQRLKILEAFPFRGQEFEDRKPGEVFLDNDRNLRVQTGQGSLIITKLQLEGGKPMLSPAFLQGHKEIIGQILS